MLIRFSIDNVLSYKDEQTLDLRAVKTCKEHTDDNTFFYNHNQLLKSAVLYGANASGKTNLLRAINVFKNSIINSSKESQVNEPIGFIPFLLNESTANSPSKFEIEFIANDNKYRYGFEAGLSEVKSEWLFSSSMQGNIEKPMFIRLNKDNDDNIQVFDTMKQGKGLEERTRKNALFLSVCAQFAVDLAMEIIEWFSSKCSSISGINCSQYKSYSVKQMISGEYLSEIKKFMHDADLDIQDFNVEQRDLDFDDAPDEIKEILKKTLSKSQERPKITDIQSVHNVYDDDFNIVSTTELDFDIFESSGTKKAFGLSGPIIDTLKTGGVLFIDELDSQLHPIFTKKIVQMFNSKEYNSNNAQLIFATHDSNLLDKDLFRRDQIWFVEKSHGEATKLYSLIDFILEENQQKVRNDASFERDYLKGRYGAIPFLGDFNVWREGNE
jgi:uncharacterized protein